MVTIRVDEINPKEELQFAYECVFGYMEYVKTSDVHGGVVLCTEYESDGEYIIQTEDIPNMIKALQAAYSHITNEG